MCGGMFGPLLWIILLILLLVGVFYLISKIFGKKDDDQAVQSLKERFVQGEISEEEYTSKKEILTKR